VYSGISELSRDGTLDDDVTQVLGNSCTRMKSDTLGTSGRGRWGCQRTSALNAEAKMTQKVDNVIAACDET
jgi:hypothetical protein